LQDKLICAIDKYTVESNAPGSSLNGEDLIFRNVGVGAKTLDLQELTKEYPEEVIQQNLNTICVKAPALMVRNIKGFGYGRPIVVVKQEVLVAWSRPGEAFPEEGPVLAEEDRGLMWLLFRKYHPARQQIMVQDGRSEEMKP